MTKRYTRNQVLYILNVSHDIGGNLFKPTRVKSYDEDTGKWEVEGILKGEHSGKPDVNDQWDRFSEDTLDFIVNEYQLEELVKLVDTPSCPLKAYKTT